MNSSVFSFLSEFVFLLLLFIQIPSSLSNDDLYTACRKGFVCGGISAGFPFLGAGRPSACGIPELELKCDHEKNITTMNISQVAYRVLEINREFKTLRIAREDYLAGLCPPQFMNSTFNPKVFEPDEDNRNFTLIYGCEDVPITIPPYSTFKCKIKDVDGQSGYIKEGDYGPGECNGSVIVPVPKLYFPPGLNMPALEWKTSALEVKLKIGFEVRWKFERECQECYKSRGVCGFNNVTSQPTCYYPGMHSPPEISL
ncbi:WALL-ASSOCIATED RECEPTOR KINASE GALACTURONAN-BINDING DOMAIN-CONTAINING PROTEIN-RELATED [Salix koriyanagi]|uniref:non-specific serine/threonine protein kinase n=1 Tax=Salix koriyanagi TaxID=2511006 RepID=A0A9Q0VSP7_9ROSI|nr:WALL-ASSOCIATED RECEPTOR KINASE GALACTURONAN-BINDING DOMAIN-CONTAINING PROTEIN-RELATED [Salix koriyanagi]